MAQDARLRERLAVRLRGALGLGVAAAAVSLLLTVGVRPDVGQALQDWRFLVKFMITTALAVSAGRLVFALGGPLPVSSSGLAGLAAGPAILATAVAAELASQPAAAWAGLAIGRNSLVCLTVIPLLSAVPLAFLLAVLRSGAPRRPGLAGAMAGLAAARSRRPSMPRTARTTARCSFCCGIRWRRRWLRWQARSAAAACCAGKRGGCRREPARTPPYRHLPKSGRRSG